MKKESHVTICDTCDFGINVPTRTRDRAWITLPPKFVAYTVLQCLLYNFVVFNTQLNGVPLKLCSVRFF